MLMLVLMPPLPCSLILFLHWCLLAHTAVVKLLKKAHKKLPGQQLRVPQLHTVLEDTCCNTDVRGDQGLAWL